MPDIPEGHQDIVEPYFEQKNTQTETTDPALVENQVFTDTETEEVNTAAQTPIKSSPLPPARDLTQDFRRAQDHQRVGEWGNAQRILQRLRGTALAGRALPEELRVLRQLNRHEEAIAVYRVAKSEIISEESTCLFALVLIERGMFQQAIRSLDGIGHSSGYHRQARYLQGLAHAGLEENTQAQSIMREVASADDAWGQTARRWLQQQAP